MRVSRRKRRRFKLTREGNAFLFVTIGVGLAAVNTANNLLYLVLGLLLSLLLVSGVLSDLALWRLRVTRSLPKRMFAGKRTLIEIIARNEKRWLASVSVEMTDEVEGLHSDSAHFVRIKAKAEERATYGSESPKRGRLVFGPIRVVTRYPFGLIEKGFTVSAPDELVVFPRLLEGVKPPPLDHVEGDLSPMQRIGRGSEFAGGVRFYREGDEARDIHWRRTAARGELVVRERAREARSMVTLAIDNRFDVGTTEARRWRERFEAEISRVATIAASYLKQGVSVRVKAASETSPLVGGGSPPDPIWRFLALLEPLPVSSREPEPGSQERAA